MFDLASNNLSKLIELFEHLKMTEDILQDNYDVTHPNKKIKQYGDRRQSAS